MRTPNKAFAADFGKAGGKFGCYFPKFGCARLPEAAETRSLGIFIGFEQDMQFLTPAEWQTWCSQRNVPLRESGWMRPNISLEDFHIVKVPYHRDSGKKVFMGRFLYSLVEPDPETLLLVDDWAVWPSCQHEPLFTRFRQTLGEIRPLIEAPGHLVTASDSDDAVSIVVTALLFMWDCYGSSSSGRDAFRISHDEYCYFGSRDPNVTARVAKELKDMGESNA